MPYGYSGKILHVDLDKETTWIEEPGEDFYGQDGTYTINPPDLTDNGDGTDTDNLTQIIWEQKTAENEPTILSYDDAVTYCENLILGGSDNWRLPTRKEYSTSSVCLEKTQKESMQLRLRQTQEQGMCQKPRCLKQT